MKAGIVGLAFGPGAEIAAPQSGVHIGRGHDGPVSLRLFRLMGTRIALAARVLPAQLIAVRAAAGGTSIQVVTSRPQLWEPLLHTARNSGIVRVAEALPQTGGPVLLIDDRPAEARSPIEIRPWQCRIDIRSQWSPAELAGFAHTDLAIFGAVAPEAARVIGATFGLRTSAADPLSRLDAGSFGMLRRGQIEFVSLNPTSAEGLVLESARGIGSAPAVGALGAAPRQPAPRPGPPARPVSGAPAPGQRHRRP
ncbi:MAG: hypothetical protein ACR2LX_11885 [Jatrophihabitans sp.]